MISNRSILCGVLIICLILCLLVTAGAATRGLKMFRVQDKTGAEVSLYKESHALVIGISDYTAGWPDLPGVEEDIIAVEQALSSFGFNVIVKKNLDRAGLNQAFSDFINVYGQDADNRLLFYFAGHGHTMKLAYGDDVGYIVPSDAPNPHRDTPGFLATALDMQMIDVYAKRIQSKHALFLFDSCFSGSIFSLSRAVPENISYKTGRPVRQFITSGSANEQVPDESIFRRQFIAALDGEADGNHDGYLTGAELGEFLQNKVVNYSNGSQHPQYGKIRHPMLDKGDFVFVLAEPAQHEPKAEKTASRINRSVDPEAEMWKLIQSTDTLADLQDFLKAFPNGRFSQVARLKKKQLERQLQSSDSIEITEEEAVVSPLPSAPLHSFDFNASSGQPLGKSLFGRNMMSFYSVDGQGCLTASKSNLVLPAMFAETDMYNFVAELEIYPEKVTKKSRYGLIFRSDDAPDGLAWYYLINIQPGYDAISLMTWKDGWVAQSKLQAKEGIFNKEAMNLLRIEVKDSKFRIAINNKPVGEFTDYHIVFPGIFGLSLIAGSPNETVCFDNFKVYGVKGRTED